MSKNVEMALVIVNTITGTVAAEPHGHVQKYVMIVSITTL